MKFPVIPVLLGLLASTFSGGDILLADTVADNTCPHPEETYSATCNAVGSGYTCKTGYEAVPGRNMTCGSNLAGSDLPCCKKTWVAPSDWKLPNPTTVIDTCEIDLFGADTGTMRNPHNSILKLEAKTPLGQSQYGKMNIAPQRTCLSDPDRCTDGLTVSIWVKNSVNGYGVYLQTCDSEGYSGVEIHERDFWFWAGIGTHTKRYWFNYMPNTPQRGLDWFQITLVMNPTENKAYMYIDGSLVDTRNPSLVVLKPSSGILSLNRFNVTSPPEKQRFFKSFSIKDIYVWDKALTATEVESLSLIVP